MLLRITLRERTTGLDCCALLPAVRSLLLQYSVSVTKDLSTISHCCLWKLMLIKCRTNGKRCELKVADVIRKHMLFVLLSAYYYIHFRKIIILKSMDFWDFLCVEILLDFSGSTNIGLLFILYLIKYHICVNKYMTQQ